MTVAPFAKKERKKQLKKTLNILHMTHVTKLHCGQILVVTKDREPISLVFLVQREDESGDQQPF